MPPDLASLARELSDGLKTLAEDAGASHVYDPTSYARKPHEHYLREYASGDKRVLLLGMNPGPWGMAQTGVPFGAVDMARGWLGIRGEIERPAREHPKRPVLGWDCKRQEVSGSRLWTLLQGLYGTAAAMARELVVLNYCPLLFLDGTGGRCRNLPMDKVRGADKILAACDAHLDRALATIGPEVALGVGAWARGRLDRVAPKGVAVGQILHPSPASPAANRGFAETAKRQLAEHGVVAAA